jgi:hypothetical protein
MSNIKNFTSWLREKKEVETSSYKLDAPTEKEHSKELASNYSYGSSKKDDTKKTSTPVKPVKKATATAPTKEVKGEKQKDVQIDNKKVEKSEPSKKGTFKTEKEEKKKVETKKEPTDKESKTVANSKISSKIKK